MPRNTPKSKQKTTPKLPKNYPNNTDELPNHTQHTILRTASRCLQQTIPKELPNNKRTLPRNT